ncbi:MAG TPA: hypothetical protein C5S50_03845 [Methanosarcinaceae archaeon]|nr:hypothetical protein [Methanosarcinaceae archaeon]
MKILDNTVAGERTGSVEKKEPFTAGNIREALATSYDITVDTDNLEEILLDMDKYGLITGNDAYEIKCLRRVAGI